MSLTIASLAGALGLDFQGEGDRWLHRVSSWDAADAGALVFWEGVSALPSRPAAAAPGCVVAPRRAVPAGCCAIFSDRPKLDFARAAALLAPRPRGTGARHPSADVANDATIGPDVDLGPGVVIGAGARIGAGTILEAGVTVGNGCIVGRDCRLHPRVVLYPGVELGNGVVLHAGVVVGADGFGYVFDGSRHHQFPQVGGVVIEDEVEVGANATIDRGSLGVTRIGAGSKIDNLVQIAHNVQIGSHVVIAAQTGISGSTEIGSGAVIGGQVGFGDHARVEGGAVIGSKAGVLPGKIVRRGEVYWGVPVRPLREYKRLNALFGRLPELKARIEALERALDRVVSRPLPRSSGDGTTEEGS